MKINPNAKFTIANTLFFGVVSPLLGGVLPTLLISWAMFDPEMHRTDEMFLNYVIGSLAVGFIPASLAGYLYARLYKKEFLKSADVNFWKELKYGAWASVQAMMVFCLAIWLLLAGDAFVRGQTLESIETGFWILLMIGLALSFLGVVSGMACSNLIREWNQKLAANLS